MKLFIEKRRYFPDPAKPTLDGIVAIGDDMCVDILLEAYSFGIFPWPHPEMPCLWFCPDDRGVIDFSELHIGRSLAKFLRKSPFQVTFNKAFDQVIAACAEVPRPGQNGTWITPPIVKVYNEFHRRGYAYSVEVWREKELVGGLYGVSAAGSCSGESMFFRESGASKVALLAVIEVLSAQGLQWLDIQMVTPVTASLGGKTIPKREYLARVETAKSVAKKIEWPK